MPRKPTGRPPGRPRGSGDLGTGEDAPRVTLRIPQALYDRLEAFAERAHVYRGEPQVSVCIRDAIAYYLDAMAQPRTNGGAGPKRPALRENIRQTEIPPAERTGDGKRQTETVLPKASGKVDGRQELPQPDEADTGDDTSQTGTIPTGGHVLHQEEGVSYDASKFYLGTKLCPAGDDYQGTGRSLIRRSNKRCVECDKRQKREARARKKAAAQAQEG